MNYHKLTRGFEETNKYKLLCTMNFAMSYNILCTAIKRVK